MDTNLHTIRVENHQLAYLAFNTQDPRPPLILLHGLTSSVGFWHKGEPYTQFGPCYALSLPGHYPAVAPASFQQEMLSAKALGGIVVAAIEQIVPDKPVTLVGHSAGGMVGLAAATQAPTKINHLITIAGFAQGHLTGPMGRLVRLAQWERVGWLLWPLFFLHRLHPALSQWAFRAYATDRQTVTRDPSFAAAFASAYTYLKKLQPGSVWPYFQMMPQVDLVYRLPRIAAATLVISGDKDPIVPPTQSEIIASRVPNSQLVMMPGVGHLPMMERPQQYNQIISTWLNES
ncbi:MAG: alpha/beta hydrolase [Anaerolineae bacterium]|nr:alpha/beta hydrolase [Anaerolineae bacterium]